MTDSSTSRPPYDFDEIDLTVYPKALQTYIYRQLIVERIMPDVVRWQQENLDDVFDSDEARSYLHDKLLELSPRDSPLQELRETGSHRFESFRFETVEEMLEALTDPDECFVEEFADVIAEEWERAEEHEGITIEPSQPYSEGHEFLANCVNDAREFIQKWRKNVFEFVTSPPPLEEPDSPELLEDDLPLLEEESNPVDSDT